MLTRYARTEPGTGRRLLPVTFAPLTASPGARAFYDQRRAGDDTHHRALSKRLVGLLTAASATAPSTTNTARTGSTAATSHGRAARNLTYVKGLRPEEARAAEILAAVLGGEVLPRDVPGAPGGTHDFDVLTTETVIAVEVTRAVHGPSLAAERTRHGVDWTCPSLAESWYLHHRPGRLGVKRLRSEIEQLLGLLERAGVAAFGAGAETPPRRDARAAIERLGTFGVRSGRSLGAANEVPTLIFGSSSAGSTSPEVVNAAVEMAAEAKAGKLMAALGADERHLFLWLDGSADQANAAMSFDVLPLRPPSLSLGVDAVWVAPGPYVQEGPRLTGRLWHCIPGDGWVNVGAVTSTAH